MTSREDQQEAKAMTNDKPSAGELAKRIEELRSLSAENWRVEKEPHSYNDGTDHFNHVCFTAKHFGEDMTVEVANHVSPNLGELLCLLNNNLDIIIAALRAASAPPATGDVRRDWQPIETAPRDTYRVSGPTLILGHKDKKWIRFGKWYVQEKCWYYSGTSERSQYAQVKGDVPTHWMPLPDAPSDLASVAPGPSEAAIQKSAPVILAPHNSGERDPAVTPDWAGADTEPSL